MRDHIAALQDAGHECVNAVGIRAAESAARSKMGEWEESATFDCAVWRPLIAWTEAEVIAIHARHGLRPNPLYLMGATRVGCWPCIFARKAEIRLIADKDPSRISRLRVLEEEVGVAAKIRHERDKDKKRAKFEAELADWSARLEAGPTEPGDAFDDLAISEWKLDMIAQKPRAPRDFSPPSWFQARTGGTGLAIDKVVDWSRTSHGGDQYDMFAADPADAGCMRWGLCDTEGSEK